MSAITNAERPETTNAAPQPGLMGNYRWVICALLFFATTINYIDRQILSLLKEILDKQIGWTNEQFGWVNSAFQFSYGIGLLGSPASPSVHSAHKMQLPININYILAEENTVQFQWWSLGLVGAPPVEQRKGTVHRIEGKVPCRRADEFIEGVVVRAGLRQDLHSL